MSSVGCLRSQWCFNKSLALGRLMSFLFTHKLTNSASSFEKVLSGTLGACVHAMHGQECSVYAVYAAQCPCSAHAVLMQCVCAQTSSSMMSESSRK